MNHVPFVPARARGAHLFAANDPHMDGWPEDLNERLERVRASFLATRSPISAIEIDGKPRIELPPLTEEEAIRIDLAVAKDKDSGRYTERRDEIAAHGHVLSDKPNGESVGRWWQLRTEVPRG